MVAVLHSVVSNLPVPSQHLLVLLFGTWRLITDAATEGRGPTRMSPEAIGISVAPSVFLTCIQDGRAKIEDVVRFRNASQVLSFVIRNFGFSNLFPRDCYEYYARITGRTLSLDKNWQFTFHYPSSSGALEREWLGLRGEGGGGLLRRPSLEKRRPPPKSASAAGGLVAAASPRLPHRRPLPPRADSAPKPPRRPSQPTPRAEGSGLLSLGKGGVGRSLSARAHLSSRTALFQASIGTLSNLELDEEAGPDDTAPLESELSYKALSAEF